VTVTVAEETPTTPETDPALASAPTPEDTSSVGSDELSDDELGAAAGGFHIDLSL
jgi:hypothetical protein